MTFDQSTYSVDEDDGVINCTLTLSAPLTAEVNITVVDVQDSATGESSTYVAIS